MIYSQINNAIGTDLEAMNRNRTGIDNGDN